MSKAKKRQREVGLQSAMMTDLVFTLFIFFILVSTIKKDAISIQAAKAKNKSSPVANQKTEKHVVTVDGKDQIYVDGRQISLENLPAVLRELKGKLAKDTVAVITLRPDANSRSSKLIEVIDALNGAGLSERLECEVEAK